jgi:hypothetical protein
MSVSSPGLAPGELEESRRNAFTEPRLICQSPSTICVVAAMAAELSPFLI